MTAPIDPSRLAGLLAHAGIPASAGEALVLVTRHPARVMWASPEALACFAVTDAAALTHQLFGTSAAPTAFAARLLRLPDTVPYRLERVPRTGHPTPLVVACHAVREGDAALAVLHVRNSASLPGASRPHATATEPAAPEADPAMPQPVTRIIWDIDATGRVTRIGAAARLLGTGAPRVGDELAARLREVAPDLAARITAALKGQSSVGVVRFAWAVDGAEAPLAVEASCAALRGGAPGLRGFFAVHGLIEAPAAGEPAPVVGTRSEDPAADEPTPLPAPAAEPVAADSRIGREPEPPQTPPAPSGFVASGNIVHFPTMRLGPVPANFVAALRPAPAPDPTVPDVAEMAAPQWSEAPPPAEPEDEAGGLSASERDAFEHIRRVLGTRPFAPPPTAERPDGPAPVTGAAKADASLRDRLPPSAVDALTSGTATASPHLDDRDSASSAAEVPLLGMTGRPAGSTNLPPEDAGQPPAPDAMGWTAETLDLVTDGHLRLDDAGGVQALSPKAARLLGIEVGDALGRPFAALLFDGHAPGWQALAAAATGPEAKPQGPSPLRLRTRTGQPLAVLVRLGRSDGALVCALTLDRPAPVPANDTAEAARREAERTSALKSEFLAKVSHEIRTPLNAILGFAEVIRDERLGPIGNPRYLEYLRDIHASGTHVMSLVNDLLDLSRIEAGRMDLNLAAVDANAVVQDCVNTLQTQAHRERVIVRLSLTPRLPPTLADERSLRQIVLNLLANAIKFNEPGGQVIVSTALVGPDAVAIRIRDTGLGMSDDEIAAAMEPFRQLSTVNRTGSGLGLPLTKALVEANCATMSIKSARREGTLVEVTFPVVEPDSVSLPAE